MAKGGNGYPEGKVKDYVKRFENIEDQVDSERAKFMNKCGKLREDQSDILEEAKSNGIPRKALRKVIKARLLEAKAEAIREDLEGEEQDQFDLLRHALGDLDDDKIKESALARMKKRQAEEGDVNDLAESGEGGGKPH